VARPTRRARPEDTIQRALLAHIAARGVNNLWYVHVPMGGKRRPIEAAILKGLGARAGTPDLLFLRDGQFFALEIKTETGHPTRAQLDVISEINAAGGFATIGHGLDRCLKILEEWKLLKGKAA
jgi:hypothetical protein